MQEETKLVINKYGLHSLIQMTYTDSLTVINGGYPVVRNVKKLILQFEGYICKK